jgi:hypothetical protein
MLDQFYFFNVVVTCFLVKKDLNLMSFNLECPAQLDRLKNNLS